MSFKHYRVLIGALLALSLVAGGLMTTAAHSAAWPQAQAATPASTATAATQAATAQATAGAILPKPVITAQINGETFAGVQGSYCWPSPDAEPCVIVDDPQPTVQIAVKTSDAVTFVIAPPPDALDTFKATLLDDKDTTGNPIESDLSASKGVFTVAATLTNGTHRLQIDAVYPVDANNSQNFISTVFALDVSGGAATTQPTANATAEVVSTEVATMAATMAAAVTEGATVTFVPPITATIASTKAPPTTAPTRVASTKVPPTPVPTIEKTSVPTVSASPEANATSSAFSLSDLAPALTISTGGQSYSPVAISAVVQEADGTQITITRPVNTNAPYIRAAPGADAQIAFSGVLPTSETITLGNSDGTKMLSKTTVTPDNLVLYALPTAQGVYVLTIEVQWPGGQATYYFRAVVSG